MAALDYYRVMGVKPNCTLEELRRRYRLLARRHHPDLNPDDPEAAARFRLITVAFEAIQADRSQAKARGRSRRNDANYRKTRFTAQAQVFEEFFGIGQDGPPLSWSAGADFRYDLEIPFVASIKGMGVVIPVEHHPPCRPCGGAGLGAGAAYKECPECQGRGRRFGGPGLLRFGPVCERCRGRGKIVAAPCRHCGGSGLLSHHQEYHLRIPPGTQDGARFRIMGEGGQGFQNGPRGNLLVVVHVAPHEFFTRVGNDIHCKVEVSFAEAALGCVIPIPTLEGCQWVNLPQGTQTGWSCRFFGAGAPGTPTQPPGDQVNQVVVTPLSPHQGLLLRELDRLESGQLDRAGHE
jgi:molecular chaperone DnaJ